MAELPTGLLEAVRNYLDITWEDADGDVKLTGILNRGMKYIDGVAGESCDYTVEDKPQELLFDYCRYVRSNALSEFQQNYLPEILMLQQSFEIKRALTAAGMTALTIGALTLSPTFSAGVYEYAATATEESNTITATPAKPDAVIMITVNGTPVENGGTVTWESGINIVIIKGKYGNVTVTYAVYVTR